MSTRKELRVSLRFPPAFETPDACRWGDGVPLDGIHGPTPSAGEPAANLPRRMPLRFLPTPPGEAPFCLDDLGFVPLNGAVFSYTQLEIRPDPNEPPDGGTDQVPFNGTVT